MTIYVINSHSSFVQEYLQKNSGNHINIIVPDIKHLLYLQYLCKKNNINNVSLLTVDELCQKLMSQYNIQQSICTKNDIQLIVNSCINDLSKKIQNSSELTNLNRDNIINEIWHTQSLNIATLPNKSYLHNKLIQCISQVLHDRNLAFEQDIANDILQQQSHTDNHNTNRNSNIVFYGFLPFPQHFAIIQTAGSCYKTADIIVHDFGDNDIFFSWLDILENIFGHIEFIDHENHETTITTTEYCNIFYEVQSVVNNIQSILQDNPNASIAIRIPPTSQYFPIICDALERNNIDYYSTCTRQYHYPAIIKLWIQWQKTRQIIDYCKFCSEMVSQNILPPATCHEIFRQIKTLQTISLFRDYDRILELGNLKNLHAFNAIDEYDICYRLHTLSSFGQCFLTLFQKFLPQTITKIIQSKLCHDRSEKTINCNALLEYLENVAKDHQESITNYHYANVIILDTHTLINQEFSHVFILGQDNVYDTNNKTLDFDSLYDTSTNLTAPAALNTQQYYNDIILQSLHKLSHQCTDLHISYHTQSYIDHTNDRSISQYIKYLIPNIIKQSSLQHSQQTNNTDQFYDKFYEFCRSYKLRHDTNNLLNEYCFAIDINKTAPTACKSLEYLLKNPHVGFYTSVLGLQPMPWTKDLTNKKITIGSLVHNFLQINNAQNICTKRMSHDTFASNINQRAQQTLSQIERACTSCDKKVPHVIIDAIQQSTIIAHKLLFRLLSYSDWQYFLSEYKLPTKSYITIGSKKLPISGIVDFVATNCNDIYSVQNNDNIIIIDFKTGNDIELTERNIATLIKKYNSLQLVLYGMALNALGIKNINILLLRHDSQNGLKPLALEYILRNSTQTMQTIENILTTGIIPKQILGKQFRQYVINDVPLATTDLY